MMYRPDLHAHTTASDGAMSPVNVVCRAVAQGVNLLAITDHDSVDGIPEALQTAKDVGIQLLPGVEISAGGEREVHVLGYGVRPDMPELDALLMNMRQERRERAQVMLEKLRTLGMEITPEELPVSADGCIGRAHIAAALVAKGHVFDIREAFDRYLSPGGAAFVPRQKVPVSQVIGIMRRGGLVPVLAHVGLLRLEQQTLLALLDAWQEVGLMGLEVYHPAHLSYLTHQLEGLARERGLIVTGGSDFHGGGDHHVDLGQMLEQWKTADEDAKALLEWIL